MAGRDAPEANSRKLMSYGEAHAAAQVPIYPEKLDDVQAAELLCPIAGTPYRYTVRTRIGGRPAVVNVECPTPASHQLTSLLYSTANGEVKYE